MPLDHVREERGVLQEEGGDVVEIYRLPGAVLPEVFAVFGIVFYEGYLYPVLFHELIPCPGLIHEPRTPEEVRRVHGRGPPVYEGRDLGVVEDEVAAEDVFVEDIAPYLLPLHEGDRGVRVDPAL